VKFWRHLVVVAFAVAVVVVLGVVWEHSGAADWIKPPGPPTAGKIAGAPLSAGPGGKVISLPPGGHLPPRAHVPAGAQVVHLHAAGESGMWFDLSDVRNLTGTVEVVAAVMAGVVVLDVGRRRWRKARRPATTSADPASSAET
jgi:hypothetical protein